mgnify:CR=1 FL=1
MVGCLGVLEDAGVLLVAEVLQIDAQQGRLVTKELGQFLHSARNSYQLAFFMSFFYGEKLHFKFGCSSLILSSGVTISYLSLCLLS